jgi:hypothetical protein
MLSDRAINTGPVREMTLLQLLIALSDGDSYMSSHLKDLVDQSSVTPTTCNWYISKIYIKLIVLALNKLTYFNVSS